jgi:hypothetical protein
VKYTQLLIFEIGTHCNMADNHAHWCPNSSPERWAGTVGRRPITDDMIVGIANVAYREHGFRGFIGWHYYNEPLCEWKRLRPLMDRIKGMLPEARFLLWTNGTMIPADVNELKRFDYIRLTDYPGVDQNLFASLGVKGLSTTPMWDDRLDNTLSPGDTFSGCDKPWSEFIIDHYGQVHLCCYDWKGEVQIGNVWDEPFSGLVHRWQEIRDNVGGWTMGSDAPHRCLRCAQKHDDMGFAFDLEIALDARAHRDRIGIVEAVA